MKTQVTVIRPVEIDICRSCRFAIHAVVGEDTASTLVWCQRRDCDNAGGERLTPLCDSQQEVVIPLSEVLPLATVGWPVIVPPAPARYPVQQSFCAAMWQRFERWLIR